VAPSVKIIENGPLRVTGAPLYRLRPVNNDAGRPVDWQRGDDVETAESFSLCRCGASKNKPFCDGEHSKIDFKDS
jgi:CDGSH-type Zn-finger protein